MSARDASSPGDTSGAPRLRQALAENLPALRAISEADSARPRAAGKWSPREILGHLIDSASNNHQRFVRARFQEDLVFPGYEQAEWVRGQNYAAAPWPELVELWRLYNLHLARVMEETPEDLRERPTTRHNFHRLLMRKIAEGQPATLGDLMRDYVAHLEHHLAQIRGG